MTIQGGWTHSSYAAPEPWFIGFIGGFDASMQASKMRRTGFFPGNCREQMIIEKGSSGFPDGDDINHLEQGNIALLCSHGSPFGPSLTYSAKEPGSGGDSGWNASGNFQWGQQGKVQWVFMEGCDALAFVKTSNGQVNYNQWPSIRNWSPAFRGITGILGFRSTAWYQPTNTVFARNAGTALANSLLQGKSFYQSWFEASDYIHRGIGIKAEIAIFPNSPRAINDTLLDFQADRTKGVDMKSVQSRIVGTGSAPHYAYKEVSDNGAGVLSLAYANVGYTMIEENIFVSEDVSEISENLPQIGLDDFDDDSEAAEDLRSVIDENASRTTGEIDCIDLACGADRLPEVEGLNELFAGRSGPLRYVDEVEPAAPVQGSRQSSQSAFVETNNGLFPLLLNYGATIDLINGELFIRDDRRAEMATVSEDSRSVAFNLLVFKSKIVEKYPEDTQFWLHSAELVYVPDSPDQGNLTPRVRVAFSISRNGVNSSAVEFL